MSGLVNAGADRCCVCRKRAVGSSLSGEVLCADHWDWAEGEAAAMAEEAQPRRKRRYTNPRFVKVFDERTCAESGCSTRYTPTGPRCPYCPEHSDARLRARREWRLISTRAKRRAS